MKTLKVILTLFFLGVLKFSSAQYNEGPPAAPVDNPGAAPSGYAEFGIGIAQPIKAFSSLSGSGYGGYAMPGNNISISFGLPIMHSNFGVALMYNYAWNGYDINSYVNNIQYSDQGNTYNPVLHDSYRENFILGGLFATIPIQRLSFDFRFMGGVALCSLPEADYEMDATSVTASQNFEWDTYQSSSAAFAFDVGGGVRFRVNRTVLMAGIDYLTADPIVNTTQRYTDQYGNSTYSHVGGTIPISMVSYSIGIGYQIR